MCIRSGGRNRIPNNTVNTILGVIFIVAVVYIMFIYPPILKPWFGLMKPKGHYGRWFE